MHIACCHHSALTPRSAVKINTEETNNKDGTEWRDGFQICWAFMEKPLFKRNWKDLSTSERFLRKSHNLSVTQVHGSCYCKHVAHIAFEFEDVWQLSTALMFPLELDACHLQTWMET